MAFILDATNHADQTPRLAWLEATGIGNGIRLTFANSYEVLAQGTGRADELDALTMGGYCVCSGDLWVERSPQPHLWDVSVMSAPEAGTFSVSAFDLMCALQQVQIENQAADRAAASASPYYASGPYCERTLIAG